MKTFYIAILFILIGFQANAQLVHCRPRICMIDYFLHDDNSPNAQKTAIITALPDLLVTCTPNSYWGRVNGRIGAIPSYYLSAGIKVYSYIAGGYGGTKYNNQIDNLDSNLSRIDGIALDGATGVFLDEVNNYPTTAGKAYITAIYNRCQLKGLKLIFNPGTSNFDSWLMTKCDYLLSDEGYTGTRLPTSSESPYLDRIIVVADSVTSASSAAVISIGARANGFGYSYACNEYINLPSWLSTYLSIVTQKPSAPVVSLTGGTLHSNAPYGNQWYRQSAGMINNATSQNYSPTVTGNYYSIVTLDGCSSDTSNTIAITSTGVSEIAGSNLITIHPNPANTQITLDINAPYRDTPILRIYDALGKIVKYELLQTKSTIIDLSNYSDGIYFFNVTANSISESGRVFIRR